MLIDLLASAGRELRDVLRAATATHRRLRDHLLTVAVATGGVDLLCATAAYFLERHSPQTEIKSFGSAAFWTTTQLLTVSSSLKNPISAGGRALDMFMEIYAIAVIATLAGAIGSFPPKARRREGGPAPISGWGRRSHAVFSPVDEQAVERPEQSHRSPRDAG